MKKYFLALIMALCTTTVLHAQSFLQLESGSLLEIKKAGKSKVIIDWDYTHYSINNTAAKDYFATRSQHQINQYNIEQQDAQDALTMFINSKHLKVVNKRHLAQYIIRLKMMNYNFDNNTLSCRVEFYRNTQDKPISAGQDKPIASGQDKPIASGQNKPIAVLRGNRIPGVSDTWNKSNMKNAYVLLSLNITSAIRNSK